MTTYPISAPTVAGIAEVTLRAKNAVAFEQSPFTFSGQAQAFPGQAWAADVILPPLDRADAEEWVSFLVSLRGQYGTFLLGDPTGATARGEAGGTPLVNGASQTGQSLVIDGASLSQTNWLRKGDYIQLGAAGTATLHKVLEDTDTDAGGNATLSIWPGIRTAPADNATVVVINTVGRWRLASNTSEWNVSDASIFGITFSAMEAIT